MKCEKCGKEHDGSFGSGRFCSVKCANSRNVSKKPLENSSFTSIKRKIKKMNFSCLYCKKSLGKDVGLDLHHIVPLSLGGTNQLDNLTYLCPNCHRLVHYNKIDSDKLITLKEYLNKEKQQEVK